MEETHKMVATRMQRALAHAGMDLNLDIVRSVVDDLAQTGLFDACKDGCKPACKTGCKDGGHQ